MPLRRQLLQVFEELQEKLGLTYLFIAHDLSVVNHISDRIGVMYLGHMVEVAEAEELIFHPKHPYTKSLIASVPIADPKLAKTQKRIVLKGEMPSPLNPPSGCAFRTRCPYGDEQCAAENPALKEIESGHFCACHHLELAAKLKDT